MAEAINDGGSAFPVLDNAGTGLCLREHGMTLRDYFAAKALEGMLASETDDAVCVADLTAKRAYAFSDAMLKAREA